MINRTQEPQVSIPQKINIQPARQYATKSGIPIYIIEAGTQDVVKIELVFAAGNIAADMPLLALATNDLLDEGTTQHDSAALAEALDFFGAYLQTENGPDWSSVSLFSLNKFTNQTLPYLLELITSPLFPEKEIVTYRQQGKQQLAVNLNKVDFIARRNFFNTLFGGKHPYGKLTEEQHYDQITSGILSNYHQEKYLKGLKAIFLSGRPGTETIDNIISAIDQTGFKSGSLPEINIPLPAPERKFIEKKDAMQSAIRIGRRLFNRSHPDYFNFSVMSTILGGYFGSRLMTNIREDKGYTYGIGAGIVSHAQSGYFYISTEVGAEVREDAVKEIYKEIDLLRNEEVSTDELNLVKNYLTGAFQRSIDGAFQLADRHKMVLLNNLNNNYLNEYLEKLNAINPATIKLCAEKYLQSVDLSEIVVGQ
jgi:zinc protease